jgi:penicillin amidase
MALSRDVVSEKAAGLKNALIRLLGESGGALRSEFARVLSAWDGSYASESKGALAFELLLGTLLEALYATASGRVPPSRAQWSYTTAFLIEDLESLDALTRKNILDASLAVARRQYSKYRDWGDIHRVRVRHFLSHLPLLGLLVRRGTVDGHGSRETLLKTSHDLVRGTHNATYGSQARYLFDMRDVNENYVVLLGGQDGIFRSGNFTDQVELWSRGEYLNMPLELEAVRRSSSKRITLRPNKANLTREGSAKRP